MADKTQFLRDPLSYIETMDLDMIIDKMSRHGWSKKHLITISRLYRNFLILMKKNPGTALVPSHEIDEFWHNHILFTRKYVKDCKIIFGKYRHHYPDLDVDKKTTRQDFEKAFNQTQELYYQEFGHYIYEVRLKSWRRILSWFYNLIFENGNRVNRESW